MRWNAKLFSLIVVLGLFGCVQTYSSKDLSDSSNAMTVEQARRIVADEIPRAIHFSDAQIQSVRATRRQIYIYTTKMTYIIKRLIPFVPASTIYRNSMMRRVLPESQLPATL